MKILVTGGSGFIGSAVCRQLILETEHSVVNVDKLTYAASQSSVEPIASHDRYAFEQVDITDAEAMRSVFKSHKPDAVMHLAAETHVDRSISGAEAFIQTNIVGTFVLLEVARLYWESLPAPKKETFKFLHVSTDEVYGSLGNEGRFTEGTAYDPSSPYSASKAASDHLLKAWHRTYGFPGTISNCSNNFGPYQFPEKLIPLMTINALEGRQLPIYGTGANVRDWLHVDDHARALLLVLTKGRAGQTYNVGASNERSNLQIVEMICDLVDELKPAETSRRELIEFVPDRPGHDARYAIDASKITQELGWAPETSFEAGIRATVEWYLDNKTWWAPLRDKTYKGERLGLLKMA